MSGSHAHGPADARKKILIVDDDLEVGEVLRRFLERTPAYDVQVATSGEDAVAALLVDAPDLLLLDITMPGMSGLEVLRRVDRTIPVIIVSANTDAAPAEALKRGAFAYIPKPFDFTYVEQLVPLALNHRRTPQPWISTSGV